MTDVTSEALHQPVGQITITITDTSVTYDAKSGDFELSIPEIVFWMDVVKAMIMSKIVAQEAA